MMRFFRSVIIGYLALTFSFQFCYGDYNQKRSLEDAGFSHLLVNILARSHVHYLEDFAELSEVQISRFEGVGPSYLKYIKEKLAEHGITLGPRLKSAVPVTDQSIELLNLPIAVLDSLRTRGLTQIGQLIILDEADLKRVTKPATIDSLREQLSSLGLRLNTILPPYDVGIDFVFPKRIAPGLQSYGFKTLRELAVLSLAECRSLAMPKLFKQSPCLLILEVVNAKRIKLQDFPFMDLQLADRLELYRQGVGTEQEAHEFLQEFNDLPLAARLALFRANIPNLQQASFFTAEHLARLTGGGAMGRNYWQDKLCGKMFEKEPVLENETH